MRRYFKKKYKKGSTNKREYQEKGEPTKTLLIRESDEYSTDKGWHICVCTTYESGGTYTNFSPALQLDQLKVLRKMIRKLIKENQ